MDLDTIPNNRGYVLARRARSGVVTIIVHKRSDNGTLVEDSFGSGFVVRSEANENYKLIVTNYHVLAGNLGWRDNPKDMVILVRKDDWERQATCVRYHVLGDLALLRVYGVPRRLPKVRFAQSSTDVPIGTSSVFAVAYTFPEALPGYDFGVPTILPSVTPGVLAGPLIEWPMQDGYVRTYLTATTAGTEGNSGGALIHRGKSIGIICSLLEQTMLVLPVEHFAATLREWVNAPPDVHYTIEEMLHPDMLQDE